MPMVVLSGGGETLRGEAQGDLSHWRMRAEDISLGAPCGLWRVLLQNEYVCFHPLC